MSKQYKTLLHAIDKLGPDAILKKVNEYEELVEALKLADATLAGSNMNIGLVEIKVKNAIAKADTKVESNNLNATKVTNWG